ncbi:MAG TPA: hypothetical protein VLB44_12155 [Kofleriaceae bacterium]|nr:hypothetical protein [Kofleriaceae bacterium]
MSQRGCAVVALLFTVTGLCAVASAGGATTMRGQLALTFSADDPGVAYFSSSRQDLRLELTIARHGSASLRVRGHVESQGTFISPPGQASQGKATRSEAEVDDRWEGRATSAHAVTTLKLTLHRDRDSDRDPLTLELACKRTMEALADAPSPRRVALQRCTPVTSFTGQPWNDLHPRYARVPLVFAVRGDVLTLVTADHEQATVGAPTAVRAAPARSRSKSRRRSATHP